VKYNGSHHHVFKEVVRKKGNSVRYQCETCIKIGPWVRFVEVDTVPDTKFDSMTLPQLRAEAKAAGIVGYSKLKKDELRERLVTLP
jgi:epoxyqueuosine reductase QueG